MLRVALAGLVMACGGAVSEAPATTAPLEATRGADVGIARVHRVRVARDVGGVAPLALRDDRDRTRDPRVDGASVRTSPPDASQPAGAPSLASALMPEVRCTDAHRCPASVGLVVFPSADPNAPHARCTGTLVAPDRVLTASHCLTTESCADAWVAFPATASHPASAARCVGVEAHDRRPDDVLVEDWAVLRLASRIPRPAVSLEARPVEAGTIVTVVSVTPHPIYASQHELDARLCRVETSERAEAELGVEARRVGWLSGCPIEPGNSMVRSPNGDLT